MAAGGAGVPPVPVVGREALLGGEVLPFESLREGK